MRLQQPTPQEIRALRARYSPVQPLKPKVWELYYGKSKTPCYASDIYSWCKAEINRLVDKNLGYKKELFKIK